MCWVYEEYKGMKNRVSSYWELTISWWGGSCRETHPPLSNAAVKLKGQILWEYEGQISYNFRDPGRLLGGGFLLQIPPKEGVEWVRLCRKKM